MRLKLDSPCRSCKHTVKEHRKFKSPCIAAKKNGKPCGCRCFKPSQARKKKATNRQA